VKKILIFVSLISLFITPTTATAAVKAGATCKTINQTSISNGKIFTCVKSGKKLIWNKGFSAPATSFEFSDPCQKDPLVPAEWASYQQFAIRYFGCARPLRFNKSSLSTEIPKSEITPRETLLDINSCKISHGRRNNAGQIAFSESYSPEIKLNKSFNIQIVPVEFTDFPSKNSPQADNGKYFEYIKNGYFNLSDGNVNPVVNVPSSYFKMNKTIESYALTGRYSHGGGIWNWKNMDINTLVNDITKISDESIDFSDVDLVFVVVPPSTDNDYIGHGFGSTPWFRSTEKTIKYIYMSPPMSEVSRKSWYGVEPFLHLHELMHAMNKLDDHYGDGDFGKIDGDSGTGNWGTMSGMTIDFILWDKWITSMSLDEQIRCASPNTNSIHWLRPSTTFGKYEKGLVIPISPSKVIVVESMRASGFNYKLPKNMEGALVYIVDTSKNDHGRGINVVRPQNRTGSIYSNQQFALSDATLKLNESIILEGVKISVIERGAFGDVVKVEKA
jgi:hypothetical protein